MQDSIYEVIALGARYWFTLLGVLIVWRAFKWLRKDRRAKHRRLRQLPDAGMIGEMVVLQGSDELPEGVAIPVPREGTLGFLRTCDMVVPVEGVHKQHIDFSFQDGKGLLLFPLRGCTCLMDGNELTHRTKNKKYPMHHGSRLQAGEAVLRLRLFEGLETGRRAVMMDDEPQQPSPMPLDDPQPQDWQASPYVYHQVPATWYNGPEPWQNVQQDAPWEEPPYADAPDGAWQQPQPWQGEDSFYPQETPWQDLPVQETPMEEYPMEDFTPAQARQRRSRLLRRRSHEE